MAACQYGTVKNFDDLQTLLSTFVADNSIDIAQAPHGQFWETEYTDFVNGIVPNVTDNDGNSLQILVVGDPDASNVVKALSGVSPFNDDPFPRMPAGGPYLPQPCIDEIRAWIQNNCPE
jgi:hypothetical protein